MKRSTGKKPSLTERAYSLQLGRKKTNMKEVTEKSNKIRGSHEMVNEQVSKVDFPNTWAVTGAEMLPRQESE